MAQLLINVGASANDGTGDRPRTAGQKINSNFTELYAWSRERVTSNRTYYVATTGSDSNTGLSPGVAFLTINHAIDVITNDLTVDEGVVITVSVASGTYTLTEMIMLHRIVGSGSVLVQGNTSTPGNVILTTSTAIGQFFYTESNLPYTIQGFRLQATGGSPIGIYVNTGRLRFGAMEFYTGLSAHVKATNNGYIQAVSNYAIIGGADYHVLADSHGVIDISGLTISLSGTPAFATAFAYADFMGLLHAYSTYTGSATGDRYLVDHNSIIDVQGQSTSFLPGDHPGTQSNGGQYV